MESRGKARRVDELGNGNAHHLGLSVGVAEKAADVELVGLVKAQQRKVGQCGEGIGAVPPGIVPETSLDIVPGVVQLPNGRH